MELDRFQSAPALGSLKTFQHRTVDYVFGRMFDDGVRCVFSLKRSAVLAPQHFTFYMAGQAVTEGMKDRALLDRIVAAVVASVVDQVMHVLLHGFIRRPAYHFGGSTIDEDAVALHVDAEHAFACRFQQQVQAFAPQLGSTLGWWSGRFGRGVGCAGTHAVSLT